LDKILEILVPKGKEPERLDLFLANKLPSVTRAKIKRLVDQECVTVNHRPSKAGHLVRPGEIIRVVFPETEIKDILPENIHINIVYEDDHLLVVNKPHGMVVHPAYANMSGTLVNALLAYCQRLSNVGGEKRPGLVHRLDKDTSGLLLVAKDDLTHVALARQLSERRIKREYRAVVWGHLKKKTDRIEAPLARSVKNRTKMTIRPEGKHAVTRYNVLEKLPLTSYLQLNLETGRTHQIRVHMSSIGHPVFADATYGGRGKQLAGLNHQLMGFATRLLKEYQRQMLHAYTLSFHHPATGQDLVFTAPLPDDMQGLLETLRAATVSFNNR
jgi:23S rRNA pseudouridine1911/1915/1917 synthase